LRFPWWPHVKRIIIHPDLPSGGPPHLLDQINNLRRWYDERCEAKNLTDLIFPQDYLIDTKERVLLKVVNDQVVDYRPIQEEFWIYPEKVGLEAKEDMAEKPESVFPENKREGGFEAYRPSSDQDLDKTPKDEGFAGKKSAHAKMLKVGRNEPCPCGSGKKYKKCCGT
jgi:hypothetical protein